MKLSLTSESQGALCESPLKKRKQELRCKRRNCDAVFVTEEALALHMSERHPEVYKCTTCDYTCTFKSQYKLHLVTHSDVRAFPCFSCRKSFKTKSDMTKHERLFHSDAPVSMLVCSHERCTYSTYSKSNF